MAAAGAYDSTPLCARFVDGERRLRVDMQQQRVPEHTNANNNQSISAAHGLETACVGIGSPSASLPAIAPRISPGPGCCRDLTHGGRRGRQEYLANRW